jgi:hypothetical protein
MPAKKRQEIFNGLNDKVIWAIEGALDALVNGDSKQAREVLATKSAVMQLINNAEHHLERRLVAAEPNRGVLFRTEFEILGHLKRTYFAAERIANVAVDVDVERAPEPIIHERDLQQASVVPV